MAPELGRWLGGWKADSTRSSASIGILLAGVFVLAVIVRIPFPLGSDFPLGDGGFTLSLIDDVRDANYALPAHGSFNGDEIPFVYPPLTVYFAALLADLGVSEPTTTLRFLPAIFSCFTVPVIFLLAYALTGSRTSALWSAISFAFVPRTYRWLVMGAGLPRALGFLFALIALTLLYRALTTDSRRWVVASGIFAGLTALAHPEAALFFAGSSVVMWLLVCRTSPSFKRLFVVGIVAVVVAAPWAVVILLRHGLAPQLAAAHAMAQHASLANIPSQFEPGAGFYVLAFVGLCSAVARRQLLVPGWLLTALLLFHRGTSCWVAVPLCLLAGVAFDQVLLPALKGARWRSAAVSLLVLGTIGYGLSETSRFLKGGAVSSILEEDRAALRWIADSTPDSARIVLLPAELFMDDDVSEWLPALTGRTNVTLMQGMEWLDGNVYELRVHLQAEVVQAVRRGPTAFDEWARGQDNGEFLFIPTRSARHPLMRPILGYLMTSPDYESVYSRDAFVFASRCERSQPE